MKYLVTGGAGFIGSNFVKYMLDKYPNDYFVCLDNLTYAANLDYLKDVVNNENFKFVKGNICNREEVFKLFEEEKFDYVINFAAESHVDRSIDNPNIFLETNVLGTQVLMDASLKYNVKRFHQVSTDEVYGDLPLDRPDLLFTESSALKPSSPYSASKASADLLVLSYHKTFKLNCTISRCSNNYGAFQHTEKLIPLTIKKILRNEKVTIYGDGKNVRDWIYVLDHCKAIDLIVRNGKDGSIYNVGANHEINNLDLVRYILNRLGKDESLITFVKDRPGHDLRYAIDPTKIETELGWKPEHNFETGILETIKWYLDFSPEIETAVKRLEKSLKTSQ